MNIRKKCRYAFWWPAAAIIGLVLVGAVAAEDKKPAEGQGAELQHRIDFGNAYVLGQSIKSGAVYLLHRKQSEIEGMLEVRKDYRTEIMEDYGLEKTAIVSGEAPDESEKEEQ